MIFRSAISDTIPSVEYICTNVLKMNPFLHEQTKPSNRNMAYSLFFYAEELTPDSSAETILNHSIFSDDFINDLLRIDLDVDSQYENPLLYYIIHRSEPFPTNSKYSQYLSNLFRKNNSDKHQPPQIRTLLHAIDFEKLTVRIHTLMLQRSLSLPASEVVDSALAATNRSASMSANSALATTSLSASMTANSALATTNRSAFMTANSALAAANPSASMTADSSLTANLSAYMDSVLAMEPQLQHLLQDAHITALDAQLAALILYSLFDSASFTEYWKGICIPDVFQPAPDTAASSDTEYTEAQVALQIKQKHLISQISIITLICLTIIQMVCLVVPFIYSQTNTQSNYDSSYLAFLLMMLIVSVILFSLRKIPFKYAKQTAEAQLSLLSEDSFFTEDALPKYRRFQNRSQNMASRTFLRRIMIFAEGLLWIIFAALSFILNSLPIFIAGVALTLIFYLEADHLLNRKYASQYDKANSPYRSDEKPIIAAGEAKIYNWDYDASRNAFRHHRITAPPQCSADCIRYIFYARINRYEYQWQIAGILLTTLNVFTLIVGILQFLLPFASFVRISNPNGFLFFCMLLMISTGIYYIIMLLKTEERFRNQMQLEYYCSNAPLSDDFLKKTFTTLYGQGILKNVDIGHGVYYYNCVRFEEGATIYEILPEDDRMLVIHRYYDAFRRVSDDFLFFTIAYVCFFVWHLGLLSALWGLPVIAGVYFLFAFYLFPKWDEELMKHKIRKYVLTISEAEAGSENQTQNDNSEF